MSYRYDVSPESAGTGRHPRHYSNNNRDEPSSCKSSSTFRNSNPTNWGPRSSFSSRKSLTESNNETKNRTITITVRDREYEHQESMDFSDNNRSLKRSRASSDLNHNNNRTISTLSSNVDFPQKTEDKSMHVRHWESSHMNIGNKQYYDDTNYGSFNSTKSLSSQNSPSYKSSRSKAQERSSRSSYYDSENESKCSDSYQSRVEEFIRENLKASRHKSSKHKSKKRRGSPTREDLELLEKLLRDKDPDLERELNKLAKEKHWKHSRRSGHQPKKNSFSCSDYEQREHSVDRESEDRSPLWKSFHRSSSSSSCSKKDQDWHKSGNESALKSWKSILKNKTENEDMFLYGNDSASTAKSQGKSQKESRGLHESTKPQMHNESDSDNNIADSHSSNLWNRIQVLNKEKPKKEFWPRSISKIVRDPIICDERSQHQDPTINNILKSIGFDVEMSKHMQERAKQVLGNPKFLKMDKDSHYSQQSKSAEMDKGLLERTQRDIFIPEKSLPCKDLLNDVLKIDMSVPPPSNNFPPALPRPPPLFPNRPPPNVVMPPLPPPLPVRYGQIPPQPPPLAAMPSFAPFAPQQQVPFQATNIHVNVQPSQFDYGPYSRNVYYDSANSLASTTAQPPTLSSNLKSDPPVPCATASASLPGSRKDDCSPHSYKRHSLSKAASLSPKQEWSPRMSQSPPPRRDWSPLSPRKNHSRFHHSSRSRDRSPISQKERLKRDRSPRYQSHSPMSQRSRSPSWLEREKISPKHDDSPPVLQRHNCFPTRLDSPNRDECFKSDIDANLDKSGSSSGDSVKGINDLSPQEIEQMKKMRLEYIGKLETLQNELNMLHKQQNELMRKKQRVKDGHKDPILVENASLQDEINDQISLLKKVVKEFSNILELSGIKPKKYHHVKESYHSKHSKKFSTDLEKSKSQNDDYYKKKRSTKFPVDSLDKSPPSLRRELSCESLLLLKSDPPFPLKSKKSLDKNKNLDADLMSSNGKCSFDKKMPPFPLQKSSILQKSILDERKMPEDEDERKLPEGQTNTQKVNFEYFDPGNHWCRHCNLVAGNIYELFQHLQSKKHKAKLDHYDRPWLPESIKNPSNKPKCGQVQMAPIKGVEFLMSTIAFYCTLCKEFSGDVLSAEAHLKSDGHNMTYQKYIQDNQFYEKRLNLDKAAGLQFFTSEKNERRKNIDDSDNEEERESSKKNQQEIKEETVKEEPIPEVSFKEEIKMVEMVEKEENIERSEESVEESNNKDCEVIILPNLDKDDSSKSLSDELPVKEETAGQSVQGSQKTKIAIKLTGKTGIKPVQYPVLPPCISVGKMPGRGKGRNLKSSFVKRLSSKEIKKPLSLDDFLTSSNKGNIPVVSESGTEATASSEAAAGSTKKQELQNSKMLIDDDDDDDCDVPVLVYGPDVEPKDLKTKSSLGLECIPLPEGPPLPKTCEQSKEEITPLSIPSPPRSPCYTVQHSSLSVEDKCSDQNEPPTLVPIIGPHHLPGAKSQSWTQEDLDDMKLLGIDPASQIPMAEIRPPPLLATMFHSQSNETGNKKRSNKSAKDAQNTSTFNKNCSTSDFSADDKTVCGKEKVSLEKAKTSTFSSLLSQSEISAKENNENSQFSTEIQKSVKSFKSDPNVSLRKTTKIISSKNLEEKVNISSKTSPRNEAITKTLSKSPNIVKEAESIPVKKKCHPDDKITESKEKKQSSVSIAKSICTSASLSGIPDVSSLNLQPTISLVPLPASLDMALSSNWEVSPSSRPDVLIRESEHNYALRFMDNSDQVRPRKNHIQLRNNNNDDDDDENDDDDDHYDLNDHHLKAKPNILKSKSSHIDESNLSSADSDSEADSDSDNSTSPPVLTQEQEQFNLIRKHNRNSNNSTQSLPAESSCHVALSCPSTMMPVTLICSSKSDNSDLFTTAEPLCIDSAPILDDGMSILNFDSVVRNDSTKSTTRKRPAKKQAAGNKSSNRGTKKAAAAAAMKKKCSFEAKADSPACKSNEPDIKMVARNKNEQEKIIVKVTSHTSEGVPVISLTAASVGNSSVTPTLPISTSSSTSMFPTTLETETGDTSLVEAAAKKAETLPKMFMPTVVLHDIKYTMGRDLSHMTAIPASIENIPIFESENESDNDVKSDLPKKSGDNSQNSLEIESPSKSSEAFDPYMFLNRPAKLSIPSTSSSSSSSTNHSSSITTCSSSHLVSESSSFTNLAADGTDSNGQVTVDSLPSLDHSPMVSNMFDVPDSKYAFPEVFLENGEPETSMKLSTIDVLRPELPFETSGKSSISFGLDLLTDFYPNTSNEGTT